MSGDADFAAVAAAIGEPARAAMLDSLLSVRARPAGELARAAGVAPSTASAHLARLVAANLVVAESHGRHRYYALAGPEVAQAVEALAALAPQRPPRSLRSANRIAAELAARSCYDHLAGALGVAVSDRLCVLGALDASSLSLLDPGPFELLGIAIPARTSRPLTRACLDWSERRYHLAGGLGAALLAGLLEHGWLERTGRGRAVAVTPLGQAALEERIGLDVREVAPGSVARPRLRATA
jgi:DNA-binding transcriptional ArsR family regulator